MGDAPNPMTPTPSEQAVFAEALLRGNSEAREVYLDTACGGEGVLRRRVEALLQAAEAAGDFLEVPPDGLGPDLVSDSLASECSEKAGDKIGRYKLLERI